MLTSNISNLVHQPLPLRFFALQRLPIDNGYELVNDLMSDCRAGLAARAPRNLIFCLVEKVPWLVNATTLRTVIEDQTAKTAQATTAVPLPPDCPRSQHLPCSLALAHRQKG